MRSRAVTISPDIFYLVVLPVLIFVEGAYSNRLVHPLTLLLIGHPTARSWLLSFKLAAAAALLGMLLLFLARLPQYRLGLYWRFDFRELSAVHRRLYWLAFGLLLPGCGTVSLLIAAAPRIAG